MVGLWRLHCHQWHQNDDLTYAIGPMLEFTKQKEHYLKHGPHAGRQGKILNIM